jgi:AcrR family transcriptional regulator
VPRGDAPALPGAHPGARRTQKRGEERRQRLLDSAASLLARREIAEVSLEDIARNADIPVTSAYHFYPDKHRLLTALAARYGEAFERIVVKPLPPAQIERWEDVIARLIDRAVRYYRDNPAARKLLIDGKTPSDIKLADRLHDRAIGALLEAAIARHFVLPEFPERSDVFYHAVEIVDVLLQVSVIRFGRITPTMVRHARIGSVAYLREFLPSALPVTHAGRQNLKLSSSP